MAAEYQHIHNYDGVLRYADNATIPPDGANRDWQQYQDYVAAGGETDPAPIPPEVVPVADPNARLDDGVTQAVDAWNANTPPPVRGGQGELTADERLLRLEESLEALLQGHGLTTGEALRGTKAAIDKEQD